MNFNFELILFYATLLTGVIYLFDILFFSKKRKKRGSHVKVPMVIDYSRSFFPVLLLVFLLRAFLFEPFRIPSGSLEPTLQIGDFILVNKYDYGLRLPVVHKKVVNNHLPERGDVVVFRWPPNPSFDFIKRVIGIPGDKISYINKELYVNGQKIPQTYLKESVAIDEAGNESPVIEKEENLLGVKHHIFIDAKSQSRDFKDIIVPPKQYLVMGDNRDFSADSRMWGFVPEENIVGKGVMIWMSWGGSKHGWVRLNRLGKMIE